MYDMAKVHKDNVSIWPVVSEVHSSEYKLAKFLDKIIKSYLWKSIYLDQQDILLLIWNRFHAQKMTVLWVLM